MSVFGKYYQTTHLQLEMVVVYSTEEDGVSVELDWSLVDPYPGLKSALELGVQQCRAENADDNAAENNGSYDDDDEVCVLK